LSFCHALSILANRHCPQKNHPPRVCLWPEKNDAIGARQGFPLEPVQRKSEHLRGFDDAFYAILRSQINKLL
jgi:hypothetical protein